MAQYSCALLTLIMQPDYSSNMLTVSEYWLLTRIDPQKVTWVPFINVCLEMRLQLHF